MHQQVLPEYNVAHKSQCIGSSTMQLIHHHQIHTSQLHLIQNPMHENWASSQGQQVDPHRLVCLHQ